MSNDASLENILAVSNKVKPHDPATPVPGIHAREMETNVYEMTCTKMFIVAFFVIAPRQKEFKCSSTSSLDKEQCICIVKYGSAMERYELSPPLVTPMNLKNIIASEKYHTRDYI